jgi:membrane protein DedA with SNARE-associated domain
MVEAVGDAELPAPTGRPVAGLDAPTTQIGGPPTGPGSRAVRRAVLAAGLLLAIAGTLGSNLAPALIRDHPVLVLALSSRNRNLLGAVPFVDPLPYALVGFFRVLVAGLVLFFIGRWYGNTALGWVEAQVGEVPATVRWGQRMVGKAGWALVLLMPGSNLVCVLAGQRRIRPKPFTILLCIGIAAKLGVLWAGGKLFEEEIRSLLDVIERYQWWIVGGLFAVTLVQSLGRARRAVPEVIEEIERDEP